jgi:hypothetical protein
LVTPTVVVRSDSLGFQKLGWEGGKWCGNTDGQGHTPLRPCGTGNVRGDRCHSRGLQGTGWVLEVRGSFPFRGDNNPINLARNN